MKTKPTTRHKSQYTKLKVIAGYFLLLSVVFFLAIITYNSFYKIINSIESLSNTKNESTLVNRIASGINEIRNASKIYSITFKSADYTDYLKKTETVQNLIDSLEQRTTQKNESNKVDSLSTIFKEYISSLNSWIFLKEEGNTNDFTKITRFIKVGYDSLHPSITGITYSTTTTITTTIRQPVNRDSLVAISSKKNNSKPSFFQKIFSSNKKKLQPKPNDLIPVHRQITTETSTRADTSYYSQIETLIGKVNETLSNTENAKKIRKTKLAALEIKLLNYQSALIAKINSFLQTIEKEKQTDIDEKISTSKQTAREASQSLLYIELIALIISLVFVYVIFKDLTKSTYYKRLLEKEKLETEKLAKAKEEFLATMSHEIRTPLTGIIGFSEQLHNTTLHANQQQQVQAIVQSSEHLLAIVNDILDYSKIESGSLKFEKTVFLVNDVVAQTLEILKHNVLKKELQLHYQPLADAENIPLLGDPFRLKQVLINLVSNSIKFTDKGYIKIETVIVENKQGYLLRCNVVDTGIGIEKNKLDDIFTDFTQADNSIAHKYGGTGLGLPISKKIVELQNGSIGVNSDPGEGSVFFFEIPYLKASENEYSLKKTVIYKEGEEFKNKKILIIDDDSMVPKLLEPIFQSWQLNYTFCRSSIQAFNLLQKATFDIIITDIHIPEIDGYEIINRIKTDQFSKNKTAKIIICTAGLITEKLSGFMSDCFILHKPFKKDELWCCLCKALNIHVNEQHVPFLVNTNGASDSYSLNNFRIYANKDKKTLELFINTFITQTKTELAEMKNNFAEKNYRPIYEIAHKLKNIFGQLEAREVLTILNDIETLTILKNTDTTSLEMHINTLHRSSSLLFLRLEKEVQLLNNS